MQALQINGHTMTRIGTGEFARVYRSVENPDIVYILTDEDDSIKEIYSHVESVHVPYMHMRDQVFYRGKWYNVFESRYYNKLTKEHTKAWEIAKILRATWNRILDENRYRLSNKDNWYMLAYDFIDALREDDRIPESIIEALDNLYTWCTAYGSNFLFEFPTRNLKINDNGDLILLDIVFFRR